MQHAMGRTLSSSYEFRISSGKKIMAETNFLQ